MPTLPNTALVTIIAGSRHNIATINHTKAPATKINAPSGKIPIALIAVPTIKIPVANHFNVLIIIFFKSFYVKTIC